MNKIMLIGNLGSDPDMNYTTGGTAVTKFRLAVRRFSKSASGEKQEDTDWFSIVAWNQLAETCNTYLHKGSKVYVEGRLQQRKYVDRNNVDRVAIEVHISDMEMLTPRSSENRQAGSTSSSDSYLRDKEDDLGDLDEHPF